MALIFCVLASATSAFGESLPAHALKTERFPLPKNTEARAVRRMIYGNDYYGHFALKPEVVNGHAVFKLFPPGYLHPIQFFMDNGESWLALGTRAYTSPFNRFPLQTAIRAGGAFTTPFVMMAMPLHLKMENSPVILNGLGEIVWTAENLDDGGLRNNYLFEKINGQQIVASGWHATDKSVYTVFDQRTGAVVRAVSDPQRTYHHLFSYIPESEEIVSLAYACHKVRWWEEFSPVFSGVTGLFNLLRLPRRTYAGSEVVRTNLVTGEIRHVWSTNETFSVKESPNLTLLAELDRFLDVRSKQDYIDLLNIRPEGLNALPCTTDWSHENSVRYYPGEGYLVSIRNFNKVILLGENGKLKWSLGRGPENHFATTAEESFSMQHDASLLPGRRVLMFNNNLPYRGYVSPGGRNKIAVYRLEDGRAPLEWQFEVPGAPSLRRGSARFVGDGRVLVFTTGSDKQAAKIHEIESRSGEIAGTITVFAGDSQNIHEAKPLNAILEEQMVRGPTRGNSHFLPTRAQRTTPRPAVDSADLQISDQGY